MYETIVKINKYIYTVLRIHLSERVGDGCFYRRTKKCVLMFYELLVDCLVIQSGSASWGGVEEMYHQFNPCSIWWGENSYFL